MKKVYVSILLMVLFAVVLFFGAVDFTSDSQISGTMPFSNYTISVIDTCSDIPRGGTPCWVAEFDGYYNSVHYNHTVTGFDPVWVSKWAIKCITKNNNKGYCVTISDPVTSVAPTATPDLGRPQPIPTLEN